MGRDNHINGLFARLSQRDMRCPAYLALATTSRLAIFELDLAYWESIRANPITLTQRWLAERMGIDPKTAARIIDDLEAHRFLELIRFGKITGPLGDRGAQYRLTWHPTNDGHKATFDNRGWLPGIPAKNAAKIGASARDIRRVEAGGKGLERTGFRRVVEPSLELVAKLQATDKSKKQVG